MPFRFGLPAQPRAYFATAITLAMLGLSACDPGFEQTPDDSEPEPANLFIGPGPGQSSGSGSGSTWLLELEEDGDFELKELTTPKGTLLSTVTGDYERFSSNFSRFSVQTASGQTIPAQNAQLDALNFDDHLLLIQSWYGANSVLPMIPDDEACPTTAQRTNWIQIVSPATASAFSADSAFLGSLNYDPSGNSVDIESRFALTADYPELPADTAIETGSCDSAVARTSSTRIYVSNNGLLLLHQGIGSNEESVWLGLPKSAISQSDLDGEYVGFWIDHGATASNRLRRVTMSCASFGCSVQPISDVADTTTALGRNFQINFDDESLDEPTPGFVTGMVFVDSTTTQPATETTIACIASEDFQGTGDKVMMCVGQSPTNVQRAVNGFFIAEDD